MSEVNGDILPPESDPPQLTNPPPPPMEDIVSEGVPSPQFNEGVGEGDLDIDLGPTSEEFNDEELDESLGLDNPDNPTYFDQQQATFQEQIDDLYKYVNETIAPQPQTLSNPFFVQTGTGNTWSEAVPLNASASTRTVVSGGPRSYNNDTVSGATLVNLAGNQCLVVEMPDIQCGLMRFFRVNPGTFMARITAVSGSFPTWTYTVQPVIAYSATNSSYNVWIIDADTTNSITGVLNRSEFANPTTNSTYTYGNGAPITSSSGQVNSTACVTASIGVGNVVDVSVLNNGTANVFSFSKENSAF